MVRMEDIVFEQKYQAITGNFTIVMVVSHLAIWSQKVFTDVLAESITDRKRCSDSRAFGHQIVGFYMEVFRTLA